MLVREEQMRISEYAGLYDILIPKDHFFRKLKKLVDFSFIYDELESKYSLDIGRKAYNPILLFLYLFLKILYRLSDEDLIERVRYDMSFKYFLGMTPEEEPIAPSTLSKFRKLRLVDVNILDILIKKSIELAIEQNIEIGNRIIVDSTHTNSHYNNYTPKRVLAKQANELRKAVKHANEEKCEALPKQTDSEELDAQIAYCNELLGAIEPDQALMVYAEVKESAHLLREMLDDNLENLKCSKDEDAKAGYKSKNKPFFGYKTHIAMSEAGIVTAATITSGEKVDGKELRTLVEKSKAVGVNVKTVVADSAYSEKENLDYATKENINLVSKLNLGITEGMRKPEDRFDFNKDAGMYVCPAGHIAIKKTKRGYKNNDRKENPRMYYYFDIEKCKHCPARDGCYKENAKSKSYSVSILSTAHSEQAAYQKTDEFKAHARIRYKIEAKNGEFKNNYDYGETFSMGIYNMVIQGAVTLFAVNIKRILRLIS